MKVLFSENEFIIPFQEIRFVTWNEIGSDEYDRWAIKVHLKGLPEKIYILKYDNYEKGKEEFHLIHQELLKM